MKRKIKQYFHIANTTCAFIMAACLDSVSNIPFIVLSVNLLIMVIALILSEDKE